MSTDCSKPLYFTPSPLGNGIGRKEKIKEFIWSIVNDTLFRWSLRFMSKWRIFLLKIFGAKVGRHSYIANTVKVLRPWNLEVGATVSIDKEVTLRSTAKIYIGDNSCISTRVVVLPGGHDVRKRSFDWIGTETIIGPGCFIGACSLIRGVKIGQFTCVGAGSLVTKDLPENVIAFGWPAKVHSERIPQDEYEQYRFDGPMF